MPGGYREQRPPAGLSGLVACLWRDEVAVRREQRVLPDGCIDLIWVDGAVFVAGPDTGAFLAPQVPGRPIIGLRFHPGAAPGVLGVPAGSLRDQRVPLEDVWPGGIATLRAAAEAAAHEGTAADPAASLAADPAAGPAAGLAAMVTRRACAPDPALRAVLARLRAGAGVAATADALGWTERVLHRRCLAAFGYGPSVLRRILRFRGALRLAERGVPFAAVAARAGYADQAHLAREVRVLAGAPLGDLLRERRT